MLLYLNEDSFVSDQRLAERVGRGGAKAQQTKTGLMEVYADAAAARPLATEVIARVAAGCGVEKAAQPPLKATLRMLEKALLRPGASRRRVGLRASRDLRACSVWYASILRPFLPRLRQYEARSHR